MTSLFKIKLLTILLLLVVVGNVFAQSNILSGKITDEAKQSVEFAKVSLLKSLDSSFVAFTQTDANGFYEFNKVKNGEYLLSVLVIGQPKYYSSKINVSGKDVLNFDVELKNNFIQVEEVSVKAKKPSIVVEDGKMTVDVENSVGNSGQTAIEVLRKAPGVSVDQDGKIQLKGKPGVQVMIDDKVMYMTEEQLANLLKSIPADQLKSIDIITSPSAKFDAAGNAGVINIKLKKGAYEGLTGLANGSIGTGIYHKSNVGVNVTYKKKKYSLSAGYQFTDKIDMNEWGNSRVNSTQSDSIHKIKNDNRFKLPLQMHNFLLKGEYHISDNTTLNLDANAISGVSVWHGYNKTFIYHDANAQNNSYNYYSNDNGKAIWQNINANVGFKHKLDTLGTELSGNAGVGGNTEDEYKNQDIQKYDSLGINKNTVFLYHKDLYAVTKQWNGQLDYTKHFVKGMKLESGLKVTHYDKYTPNNIIINEADSSNHFLYKLNVFAAYAMATGKTGKWSYSGGLRYEYTQLLGRVTTSNNLEFNREFGNLFPSGNISYAATEKTSYALMYSRRITRPEGGQLNPVQNILDPYTSWGGDPKLLPQYADNVEFTVSMFGGVLIPTVNYTYIANPIVWVNKATKEPNKLTAGPRNLEFQKNYGLSISFNKLIAKWWVNNNNFLLNNNQFVGKSDFGDVDNQVTAWGVKSTQTFTLPKEVSIEVSGLYDSPNVYAYAFNNEKWQLNFAVQKKLWNKKATIKLAFNDMFYKYQFGGHSTMGTTYQVSNYRWDNRTVMLSFSYKFGKKLLTTAQ